MRLGKYFTIEEMTVSQMAVRLGRPIGTPPPAVLASLQDLVVHVLDPLRELLDRPVTVMSGYRPEWLNKAVGGARNSQHVLGEAADIIVPGMKPYDVAFAIADSGIKFDQVILEFGQWTHVSHKSIGPQRRSILTAVKQGKATAYLTGLRH